MNHAAHSRLRADLADMAERFAAADRRALRAAVLAEGAELEAAEAERREAAGEFWAAGQDLADLLLLLFRYALKHQPDALRALLLEVLRPDLTELAEGIANLEGGRP